MSWLLTVGASSALAALPEFNAPFPATFVATGAAHLETASKSIKIKCKAEVFNTIEGPHELDRLSGIVMRECKQGTAVCTEAETAGQFGLHTPEETLGYIDEATKRVGIEFKDVPGFPLSSFKCGEEAIEITGSIVGEWAPVNEVIRPYKSKLPGAQGLLLFNEKKGHQSVTNLEGVAPETLKVSIDGGPVEELALKLKSKLGGDKVSIEVRA